MKRKRFGGRNFLEFRTKSSMKTTNMLEISEEQRDKKSRNVHGVG